MPRGLYGQMQGDERRNGAACVSEHFADNQVAEGEVIAVLRRMFSEKKLQAAAEYMETLRLQGFSDSRISAIYGMASAGVAF